MIVSVTPRAKSNAPPPPYIIVARRENDVGVEIVAFPDFEQNNESESKEFFIR